MGNIKVRFYGEKKEEVEDLLQVLKRNYSRVSIQGILKNERDPFSGWWRGIAEIWVDDDDKKKGSYSVDL